ncbi:nucleoside-diphosphate kinase [Nematocida homosporus]|uniref:nucleoside-diphosphate kinase n=1 Tax=Nematocida homosporus TaxID=1912981 RepID=UPI00221F90A1|nr:nucleoside-diphosphate kinase [Nematocida homosporus]KAI5186437.1 nucleoside-diphosphate kinase [Nematocida homosporus]
MEYTYVMIKPDGVKRRLVGEIITRIEKKGFGIEYIQTDLAKKEVLEEHYGHLKDKPFFPAILEYMTSGPVVKMIVSGDNVVAGIRKLLGATNPAEAEVGTIRGDLAVATGRNLCHASDSFENAKKEVGLWTTGFNPESNVIFDHALIYE